MSSIWGKSLKISVFGESHSSAIGVVINGLPAGIKLDMDRIAACMKRRMPASAVYSTARKEADHVEILSGLFNGYTTGTPLTGLIKNKDAHSLDYDEQKYKPRPSHADLTGSIKYDGYQDYRGGGHFSGRLTAPIVFAGAIAEQWLEKALSLHIGAHIYSIGKIKDDTFQSDTTESALHALKNKDFAVLNDTTGKIMLKEIANAKSDMDSIGGIVECNAFPMPVGLGDPLFDSIESVVSGMLFSIPGVKGVEFGTGFAISEMHGSQANDAPVFEGTHISYKSNNNGGILGGISNGMPLIVRAAIKPTPSIAAAQETVDLLSKENTTLQIKGRHDACIIPRAVEVVRCALAICLADLLLEDKKYD